MINKRSLNKSNFLKIHFETYNFDMK